MNIAFDTQLQTTAKCKGSAPSFLTDVLAGIRPVEEEESTVAAVERAPVDS
jgi:hypothetical protein